MIRAAQDNTPGSQSAGGAPPTLLSNGKGEGAAFETALTDVVQRRSAHTAPSSSNAAGGQGFEPAFAGARAIDPNRVGAEPGTPRMPLPLSTGDEAQTPQHARGWPVHRAGPAFTEEPGVVWAETDVDTPLDHGRSWPTQPTAQSGLPGEEARDPSARFAPAIAPQMAPQQEGLRTPIDTWVFPLAEFEESDAPRASVERMAAALRQAGQSLFTEPASGDLAPQGQDAIAQPVLPERAHRDSTLADMLAEADATIADPAKTGQTTASAAPHEGDTPVPIPPRFDPLNIQPKAEALRRERSPVVRVVQSGTSANAGTGQTTEITGQTGPITVNIVRQEVHLPPVRVLQLPTDTAEATALQPKSTGQAADNILNQIRAAILPEPGQDLFPQRTDAGSQRGAAPQELQGQVVKVVEMMLRPATLGLVTVTMRLTGTGLRVMINASESETAQQLQEHEDALKGLLGEAGYGIEGVDVTFRSRPEPALARPVPLFGGRM